MTEQEAAEAVDAALGDRLYRCWRCKRAWVKETEVMPLPNGTYECSGIRFRDCFDLVSRGTQP
jgi:hypothetical protein